MCKEENLRKHLSEAYPRMEIYDIQFAYDVTKLIEVSASLRDVTDAKRYGERYARRSDKELKMYPYAGARCCCCFCMPCVDKVRVGLIRLEQILESN